MGLSDHEARQAVRAQEVKRIMRTAGLDPDSFAGVARTAADIVDRQSVAQQFAITEKLVGIGIPSLAAVTAGAWGVEKVASKWAQNGPKMTWLADHAEATRRALQPAWASLQPFLEQMTRLTRVIEEFQRAWRDALPANLREIKDLRISDGVDFMAEEGIPLYLVPRQSTVEALLDADGHRGRRRVLGTRADSIIADCREVWNEHQTPVTSGWVGMLEAAARAFEGGHTEAAQSLFTVVFDSIMFAVPERRRYIKHDHGNADYEDLLNEEEFDTALVMIPIWSVYEENWERRGHPIPQRLNRHATLHRAHTRQYSKRNAVQASMLATSLLAWFARYVSI